MGYNRFWLKMADVESKSIPHELPSPHWLKATGQCVLKRYLSATMFHTPMASVSILFVYGTLVKGCQFGVSPVNYSDSGTRCQEEELDLRKLTFLGSVLLNKGILEYEIAQRQLAVKTFETGKRGTLTFSYIGWVPASASFPKMPGLTG